ncbi:MAG: sulfurtransferase [Gammaproteobacteria bacterium]|nr:sulfurtransferase [Gammaproteobacteria bacterium]MBT8111549.1 sulfurtransferase [Gammaproteobacteria bacterium]NND47054.1 sulfurtransferase [Woeseiaceae bacterium]NNL46247.1 sulfurtransferase [Woeseiaceae bacterium]
MRQDSNLIDAHALKSQIDDSNLRIIDCRFDLADPGAGRRAYMQGHIPGAVFADLDRDLAAPISPQSGRHPLPDVNTFAATLGRLGIGNASDVIVYDAGNGAVAARAWWLLRWLGHTRVRLLDGGFAHWITTAGPIVSGAERFSELRFRPDPRDHMVLTTAELESDLDAIAGLRLYDARDAARFRGDIEPIDPVAGHIPGSLSLPFPVSLDTNGRWKSKQALEALWLSVLGEDRNTPWAVMCGSGVTACHLAISGVEAGYREPRLYVGSWSEWIRDSERPVGLGNGSDRDPGAADSA